MYVYLASDFGSIVFWSIVRVHAFIDNKFSRGIELYSNKFLLFHK